MNDHYDKLQRACPKCGHGRVTEDANPVKYHRKNYPSAGCVDSEHLHYTCFRCAFTWSTDCLDADSSVASGAA